MHADGLQQALERSAALVDQLGMAWAPGGRLSVSVHGLGHDQIHRIGGPDEQGYRSPIAWKGGHLVSTARATRLGWRIGFVGKADLSCQRCRELIGMPDGAEVGQMAGIAEVEL